MKNFALATLGLLFSASLHASTAETVTTVDGTELPAIEVEPELAPVQDEIIFNCSKGPIGKAQYTLSIELTETKASIFQSSMFARYAPIELNIARAESYELPETKAKFECVYKKPNDPMKYRAKIEVHEDKVVVLQSSMNARFAPVVFDIAKDLEIAE